MSPTAPPRACLRQPCAGFAVAGARHGLCAKHAEGRPAVRFSERRGSPQARGYGKRWRRARHLHLSQHPLCAECARYGRTTAATCVDHIRPHRGDAALFWDATNWQSLCDRCHRWKTGRGE